MPSERSKIVRASDAAIRLAGGIAILIVGALAALVLVVLGVLLGTPGSGDNVTGTVVGGVVVSAVFVIFRAVFGRTNVFEELIRRGVEGGMRRVSLRDGLLPKETARHRAGVPAGRLVRAAAALMPVAARERWLEDIAISLHEFPPAQHHAVVRDFLANAPAVIAGEWLTKPFHRAPARTRSGIGPSEPPS